MSYPYITPSLKYMGFPMPVAKDAPWREQVSAIMSMYKRSIAWMSAAIKGEVEHTEETLEWEFEYTSVLESWLYENAAL